MINPISATSAGAPAAIAPGADRDALRLSVAARDYPVILFSGGALVILFTVLTLITEEQPSAITHLVDAVVAVFLIAAAVLLRWGGVPIERQPWVFASVGTVFALSLLYKVTVLETPLYLTYVAIVMCAFGPCTLSWRPFLLASGVVLVAVVPVTVTWPEGHWVDWTLVILAATLVSCVLLGARLRGINALADTNAFARRLASTDQLTGLLNRYGFMQHVPGLLSMAERHDSEVFVVFVDIRGLKQANDRFGHEFGDHVIQAAAGAVSNAVRGGDLVARWGGDEIIVMGMGRIPEGEAFNERLQARGAWNGENREQWSGDLSVGFAEGVPSIEAVEEIISRADGDMYRRRLQR